MRAKFEEAWGVSISPAAGLRSTEVLPAAVEGRVKGLFICGEDPVRSDPDTAHVIRALESLEFLVVDELFLTETAKYADVVLPGRSYAERKAPSPTPSVACSACARRWRDLRAPSSTPRSSPRS